MTPRTLVEALDSSARSGRGELVFHLDGGIERVTSEELAERAAARASALVAAGFEPGDRLGLLGPNRPQWAEWAYAAWMAGGTLVPLQFPIRVRDPVAFSEQVTGVLRAAGCRVVAADPRLQSSVPEDVRVSWDEPRPASVGRLPEVGADDVAVLQFTSGSTAEPKGAEITHGAIVAERLATIAAHGVGPSDRFAGWLPYFHDGGLVLFMIHPTAFGVSGHVLPTERYASDPAGFLRMIDRHELTYTGGPPSAFWVSVRAARNAGGRMNIGCMRVACMGAECVDPALMDRILDVGSDIGLRPESAVPTYGLAEAVACVSSSRVGDGMRTETVDLETLATAGRAVPAGDGGKRITSCGYAHPGVELRILGPQADAPDRVVGEVLVRGPALMRGYVGSDAEDPFVDGWLRTGDLGYLAGGELFITGRLKDVVIVSGQNYCPEDFEWAAARTAGVRGGRCAAFARSDEESVVLVIEPAPGADPDELAPRVRGVLADVVGRVPAEVLVVGPGSVHKTTSGKLRRAAVRSAYARGELQPLARSVSSR